MTVLFKPILALHYHFFKLSKLLGGGGQNDTFALNFFIWGRLPPPPPPQDRRLWYKMGGRKIRAHSARLIRVGSRGPAEGPLPGVQGAVPPEALDFSANKGLQDGRQE